MLAVELDGGGDVDVAHAVAIRAKEGIALHIFGGALDAATRHRILTRLDQRHRPGLGLVAVDLHLVRAQVERHVRTRDGVFVEVLLDDVALVAAADHEVIDAVRGIDLHDVPENGLPADLDHRLGAYRAFFADPGAEAAGKNDRLHGERSPRLSMQLT